MTTDIQNAPKYQQLYDLIKERIESGRWQPGMRIPTQRDLMAEHNLSYSTVSRALQELTRAGLITRRVGSGSRVAERLPTSAKTKPSVLHLIGGVPPAEQRGLSIFRDLVQAAIARNATVEPHEGLNQAGRARLVDKVLARREAGGHAPEGIVFPFFAGNRVHIDRLRDAHAPYVVMDVPHMMPGYSVVLRDHRAGARRLVQRLIDAGHAPNRIGLILGTRVEESTDPAQWEWAKARGALDALGKAADERRCEWQVAALPEAGEMAVRRLLERAPELTAIYCDNECKMEGVVNELTARGWKVPQRISLACLNKARAGMPVRVTCAWADAAGVGEAAAEVVFRMLTERAPTSVCKELSMRFDEGASIGPPAM